MRTVLEGSVRKAGNRLRISAQLVNVADGYQLWSETYNRELEDVFAIQDEIAQNIAKALRVILSEKEKRAIEKAPTANVQAYEYYLRGRQFFHQFRRKGFEFARQMFARAIAHRPELCAGPRRHRRLPFAAVHVLGQQPGQPRSRPTRPAARPSNSTPSWPRPTWPGAWPSR